MHVFLVYSTSLRRRRPLRTFIQPCVALWNWFRAIDGCKPEKIQM